MKPTRRLSRRSFVGLVAGAAFVGGAALTRIAGRAEAQVTDSDTGRVADPPARGRGRTGLNDSDPADPVGNGRGRRAPAAQVRRTGLTDADSSTTSDPVGNGRGRPSQRCVGYTDGDRGSSADRAGCGRGRPRR